MTLGLYNSYDPKRFAEAHRRALARAGAVACAFDTNLVTFGFPFSDLARQVGEALDLAHPERLAHWVAGSTTIGKNGRYFIELAEAGRFHMEDLPKKGFPPQYGKTVLATSRIARDTNADPQQLADELARGQSLLLVIGLGPHGFPRKTEQHAHALWDLTGKGVSMETCTALGAAPAILNAHLAYKTGDRP